MWFTAQRWASKENPQPYGLCKGAPRRLCAIVGVSLEEDGVQVDRVDHFVLTVRDIEVTCDFYSRVLGMEVEEFEGGRRALKFGRQKINLHQTGAEFEPKAGKPKSLRQ